MYMASCLGVLQEGVPSHEGETTLLFSQNPSNQASIAGLSVAHGSDLVQSTPLATSVGGHQGHGLGMGMSATMPGSTIGLVPTPGV
jgi:hypothetical protein